MFYALFLFVMALASLILSALYTNHCVREDHRCNSDFCRVIGVVVGVVTFAPGCSF